MRTIKIKRYLLLINLFFVFFLFQNLTLASKSKHTKVIKSSYFQQLALNAKSTFEKDIVNSQLNSIDYVFLKLEKSKNFSHVTSQDLVHFSLDELTDHTIALLNKVNNSYKYTLQKKIRNEIQLEFYGLSQAIKYASQLNLSIDVSYFDRLHDTLIGQSTQLFYSSYKESSMIDLFFSSYYLYELKFPMDLVAKHIVFSKKSNVKLNSKNENYYKLISYNSLLLGQQINKINSDHLEILFNEAKKIEFLNESELKNLQKSYLKQLSLIGDQDKIKEVKKELASSLLWSETKKLFDHPLNFVKYIQFLVGYIFVAWPLEVILIILALIILAIQSTSVLSEIEKYNLKWHQRIWMMFTRSYLNNNVPFFSKLAVSLVLFGVGLYFNSARNFVESLISSTL